MDARSMARLLGGEALGNRILCPGPGHSPRDRSLQVLLTDRAPGGYVVHSFAGDDWRDCQAYVRSRLGLGSGSRAGSPQVSGRFADPSPMGISGHNRDNGALAAALWAEAVSPRGTLAERYLERRRIPLDDAVCSLVLRYHPSCPWWDAVRAERRYSPALLAAFRGYVNKPDATGGEVWSGRECSADVRKSDELNSSLLCSVSVHGGSPAVRSTFCGDVVAVQRVLLAPDGSKLDRMMLGPVAGAAMKLSGLGIVPAALTVGEGLETGLAAQAMGYGPVWALGSAGMVRGLPVLDGVTHLRILTERDNASARAVAALTARYRSAKVRVSHVTPKAGCKDANDAVAECWL